jgi:IclR family transcriptional regulator, acetate operon repressor
MEGHAIERQGGSTRAVERALHLLEAVARSTRGARLSDLARDTDVPASTALRLLRTLEQERFVRRDDGGGFHAGSGLLALVAALDELPLIQLAEPHLRELVDTVGETASLGVLDEAGDALYLAQVQSPHAIRYASWRGRRVPGGVSALGLALHGTAPPVLRRDAVEEGVTAIAAPVHGPSGAIVAALSVTGPTFRLDGGAVDRVTAALAGATAALSRELGATLR